MPQFRKLSAEEVRQIEWSKTGIRKVIAATYDEYLKDFNPGDYAESTLEPGEKRMTVMNRLKAAAERHDPPLTLTFRRTGDENLLRFVVSAKNANNSYLSTDEDVDSPISQVISSPIDATHTNIKKRPGRPPKARAESDGSVQKKKPGRPPKATVVTIE